MPTKKQLELVSVEAWFFPLIILLIGISTITTIYIGGLESFKEDGITVYKNTFQTSSTARTEILEVKIPKDNSAMLRVDLFGYRNEGTLSHHRIEFRAFHNLDNVVTISQAINQTNGAGGVNPPTLQYTADDGSVKVLMTAADNLITTWNLIATFTR